MYNLHTWYGSDDVIFSSVSVCEFVYVSCVWSHMGYQFWLLFYETFVERMLI